MHSQDWKDRDYKKIVAWQRGHDLTLRVYALSRVFPREETYGLTSQIRRAAYSVPANIAEGSGRNTGRDYLRYLYVALGSLKETEYFLLLSRDLHYLDSDSYEETSEIVNRTFATLHGLIKAVRKEAGLLGGVWALFVSGVIMGLGRHLSDVS